jgi:ParB family chromosome partitioning protein
MTTLQHIPLCKLVPSPANARKTAKLEGVEDLAASIEAHGLLQNLQVRPAAKPECFDVVAGGRRLAALNLLRRKKALAKDHPVPCQMLGAEDALEISLAENAMRLAMHPADQFEAFQTLANNGKGPEEIAARFGVTPLVVRQRLRLASVSPVLINAYRDGDMNLDQLMAFSVSGDPKAQERVWSDLPSFNRSTHAIRAALTRALVEVDDRRVALVGIEAYLAAGGTLRRDLFQDEHEGYLTNPELLDQLVTEKLSKIAETLRAEGWAWIEIAPISGHRPPPAYQVVRPIVRPLTPEELAQRDSLSARYDALIDLHGDDPAPEAIEELDAIDRDISEIGERALTWRPEDLALAGAIISLDYDGRPRIERGLVRPEDARRLRQATRDAEAPTNGSHGASTEDAGVRTASSNAPGLSTSLIEALTSERTAALRALLMDDRKVALASLAHALILSLFYLCALRGGLKIDLASRDLPYAEGALAHRQLDERYETWRRRLPAEPEALLAWLLAEPVDTLLDLLVFCAAMSLDAVEAKGESARHPRFTHANALAAALKLDMRQWWEPTKDRYLGQVSKRLILDAVREGVSAQAAENLAALKKDELVKAAEERLAGCGWLPAILRSQTAPEEAPQSVSSARIETTETNDGA